ncbi:MAG: hypothetical protein JWN86_1761 [Planctomycetota bacterium]|nr:hypothetical protein [Planctomycetota bacterium]
MNKTLITAAITALAAGLTYLGAHTADISIGYAPLISAGITVLLDLINRWTPNKVAAIKTLMAPKNTKIH